MASQIRSALNRAFARHYAEMVVVMLVGMGVLALPAQWLTDAILPGVDGDDTTLMLSRMAATMTLPMLLWMRWRGHNWRPTLEMAAAMIVPAVGTIALYEAGAADGLELLMTVEHVAMFAAMFLAMIGRPGEYSHSHRGAAAASTATAG